MKKLTQIGIKNNTDKSTYHGFTEIYDDIFKKYKSPRILEIGVYNFGSIKTYIDYFENPYIVGMDVDDKTEYLNDKWKFVKGDQSNIEDLKKCVFGESPFDIILDDGGHTMKQQQISFGFLIDYVVSEGYYILEDVHTSFIHEYIDVDCKYTTYQMIERINQKMLPFSNYIDINKQEHILNKINNIEIYSADGFNFNRSMTSIINFK